MTPKIKYALKLEHREEYLRDKESRETSDAYTDDLGNAQLFDSSALAASEKRPHDRLVPIDAEGGLGKMSPLEFLGAYDEIARELAEAQQTIANTHAERERYTSMAVRLNEEKGWLEKDLVKAEKIIARQWAALTQIEEALSDDNTERAQRINAIIRDSIEEGSTQS